MSQQPFIIERVFDAPAAIVWQAITDSNKMKEWYFDLPGFKAEEGYEFEFQGGTKDRTYRHLCKITDVIPGKKLRYSWSYDGFPGMSFVSFELFAEGNKTRLKLTHEGLETFPDNPDFAKENFVAGWTDIIGRSLKDYLERVAA